ncbi:MAG: 23S rRNA (uracil(1939)-C(5))-methyltransferase RlmD [Firmicutes bacterium]|nr:23S rRNA (uracil(1939)-C(5))-methyltransferase RlmD [Bacillota bacterium]
MRQGESLRTGSNDELPGVGETAIEITGINHQGEGVGRLDGLVVFVPGTVPGERVLVELTEVRRSYARGKLVKIIAPSGERVALGCALAERCGGCALRHVAYPTQLRLKTELVRQVLARTGGITGAVVRDTIGMARPLHYRNNIQLKVRRNGDGVEMGFYEKESHSIVKVAGKGEYTCLLARRELNRVAEKVQALLGETSPGAPLPGEVALRRGGTGEIMVVLSRDTNAVEGKNSRSSFNALAGQIASIPGVVSVVEHARQRCKKPGGRYHTLAGRDYIIDELDGLKFRISAPSFFQVNPEQTAVLYRKTLEYCGLRGGEEVADAYCGVGAITIYLARHVKEARGYELAPRAVADARVNADLNKIKNTGFYAGAVEKVLPEQVAAGYRPDVVVLDPPRAGCRPAVLEAVARSGARRVVYVSCDPATLARDIARLSGLGYQLQEVQPVDMFPHTAHVETCVLITRV